MEKTSFELKAGYNSFETAGAEGKLIRLEEGTVYTTSDPSEIATLQAADAVKTAEKKAAK